MKCIPGYPEKPKQKKTFEEFDTNFFVLFCFGKARNQIHENNFHIHSKDNEFNRNKKNEFDIQHRNQFQNFIQYRLIIFGFFLFYNNIIMN